MKGTGAWPCPASIKNASPRLPNLNPKQQRQPPVLHGPPSGGLKIEPHPLRVQKLWVKIHHHSHHLVGTVDESKNRHYALGPINGEKAHFITYNYSTSLRCAVAQEQFPLFHSWINLTGYPQRQDKQDKYTP